MSHLRPVFYGPGIYAITCMVDNRKYIGQSKNISKRWASHIDYMNNARNNFLEKPYTSPDPLSIHGMYTGRKCIVFAFLSRSMT